MGDSLKIKGGMAICRLWDFPTSDPTHQNAKIWYTKSICVKHFNEGDITLHQFIYRVDYPKPNDDDDRFLLNE